MPLGPEDWLRLEEVFEGARVLPADQRPAYLAGACHENPALREEVEQLIASHERDQTFLERPAVLFDDNIGTKNLPSVPERIGRYRITATLGQGGMSVVYAAFDEQLQRSIALNSRAAVNWRKGEWTTAAIIGQRGQTSLANVTSSAGDVESPNITREIMNRRRQMHRG